MLCLTIMYIGCGCPTTNDLPALPNLHCEVHKKISTQNLVVESWDKVGFFCLPNSTESEKNFYVIQNPNALESVQNYRSVVTS